MRENRFRDFLTGVACTLSAMPYLILEPLSLSEGLWTAGVSAAVVLLPHRWSVFRNFWVWLSAAAVVGYALRLLCICQPNTPLWQWAIAWILLTALLCYFGSRPLHRAGILVGLGTLAFFTVAFICCLPMYDGKIQMGGVGLADTAGGILVLTGCALSCSEQEQPTAWSKWGALTGCMVWVLGALSCAVAWSSKAFSILEYPLKSAWQRIDSLTFFSCPDTLLCGVAAVGALWQGSRVLCQAISIVKKRRNSFTKRAK